MPSPATGPDRSEKAAFWSEPLAELFSRLGATPAGLSSAEAASRLARYGPNVLRAARRQTFLLLALSRFRNPLVVLLIVAGVISALTGDATSSVIIVTMAFLSVMLDSVQEYRAGAAAERLRQSVAVRVSALRDGKPADIPARELVPGDVVALAAGDLVPADGRVLEARDCFVNQALLTGEPYPVEKHPVEVSAASAPSSPGLAMNEAVDAVLMGTSTVSGSARVLICATGSDTALGEIGTSLSRQPRPAPGASAS
jgi:Mg2+-importing ATPase